MRYAWRYHMVYELGVGHLWTGALMTENKHGAPLTLSYLQVTYQFKASKTEEKKSESK